MVRGAIGRRPQRRRSGLGQRLLAEGRLRRRADADAGARAGVVQRDPADVAPRARTRSSNDGYSARAGIGHGRDPRPQAARRCKLMYQPWKAIRNVVPQS